MPVRNQADLERRKAELSNYMQELVRRSDTRNSKELVKFLELDKFAPEMLIHRPKLIEMLECG